MSDAYKLGEVALNHVVPMAMLVGMAVLFIWVLFSAQQSATFDASDFLRDERGVLSFGRLAAFVCMTTHTWAVSVWVIRGVIVFNDMALYCVVWSGSLILLRAMDIYRGVKLGVVPDGLAPTPSAKPPDGETKQ